MSNELECECEGPNRGSYHYRRDSEGVFRCNLCDGLIVKRPPKQSAELRLELMTMERNAWRNEALGSREVIADYRRLVSRLWSGWNKSYRAYHALKGK